IYAWSAAPQSCWRHRRCGYGFSRACIDCIKRNSPHKPAQRLRAAHVNNRIVSMAEFTNCFVKKERCRERSARIAYHADVQEQHSLFRGGSRVQEEIYSDGFAREQRQPVPRGARARNAPQYSEPHHFRTEDRCPPTARWRQAPAAQRQSSCLREEGSALGDSPRVRRAAATQALSRSCDLTRALSPVFASSKGRPQ